MHNLDSLYRKCIEEFAYEILWNVMKYRTEMYWVYAIDES